MGIISILRTAALLLLILGASVFATLLPDLIGFPSFTVGKSDALSKSSSRASPRAGKDPRLAAIEEAARRTSPEAKKIIERAWLATPEFEGSRATKTLGEMIDDSANEEGLYRIEPLGWDASQARDSKWRLKFHYHRWPSLYLATEWEYDTEADRLRLLKTEHGPEFWMTVANLQALKAGR
jgi:hypothetical protein